MKKWIIASAICTLPAFFTLMVNTMCAFFYWNDLPIEQILKMNHQFVFWSCLICLVCNCVIITTQLQIFRYSDSINNLEKAKEDYYNATKRMEITRDKYTDLLEKNG